MARYAYELLSPQDTDFLLWERPGLPMHTAGTQIFRAGPLAGTDGGIDFAAIRRSTERVLHRVPRYRQKVRWIPGSQHAVWVDDASFNLDYHLRHTALPRPGSESQLKTLSARIMEHPLDRSRPLWEMWVVEGLEGGCFALIAKVHHCMIDGASGVVLAQILMSSRPDAEPESGDAPRWMPRPEPDDAELLRYDRLRRLLGPLRAAGRVGSFLRETPNLLNEVGTRVRALESMAMWKLWAASETPFNGPIGPHRAFEWLTLALDEVKEVRRAAGCKLNDVVLATVAGAVRRYMKRRGVAPEKLDFRVSTPVDVRRGAERERISGNRVSSWIVRLPLAERDPLARLAAIHRETQALKETQQSLAFELVNALHEWLPIDIQSMALRTMNTVVTNVPGPTVPLYLCGAELLAVYPQAPLLADVGLVTGVLSYDGRLCWGINADSDRVPDLDVYAAGLAASFHELAEALGVHTSGPIVVTSPGAHDPERAPRVEPAADAPAEPAARRAGARGSRREMPPAATH